jgi:hypothetical protein
MRALTPAEMNDARRGLQDGRVAMLLELEAEIGVLVISRPVDRIEPGHLIEQIGAYQEACR